MSYKGQIVNSITEDDENEFGEQNSPGNKVKVQDLRNIPKNLNSKARQILHCQEIATKNDETLVPS